MKFRVSTALVAVLVTFSLPASPAYAGNSSVSIQALTPGTGVDAGSPVSFIAVVQGFSDPIYSVVDSTPTAGGTSGGIDKIGVFSWTPIIYDAGRHLLIVSVSDALGDSASTSVSILVRNNNLVITGLTPGTAVNPAQTVTFKVVAPGFQNPVFNVFDSVWQTSVSTANIDATGLFTWIPTNSDVGTHTLILTASDTQGRQGQITQNITVTLPPPVPPPGAATTTATTTPTAVMPPVNPSTSTTPPAPAAASGASYVFTTALGIGSRGTAVTQLQKKLAALGFFSAQPSGYYGPVTAAAVAKFQKAHGLPPVAVVGPATRKLLNAP